jgi:putative ABC transport system ATP-binding protein
MTGMTGFGAPNGDRSYPPRAGEPPARGPGPGIRGLREPPAVSLAPGAAVGLESVTKVYGSGARAVTALDRVTIAFAAREFTAIMGPSGSGKTTLLQVAAGIDRPTSGQVRIGDTELSQMSERRLTVLRRRRVGFVFQSFNLMGSLTAEQNVALPLRLDGRRPKAKVVREALARVGLDGRARHRPGELSGGQQQRVAIARALVTRPEVIFADEPTGALDRRSGGAVLDLLRAAVDGFGQTLVMVTHDPVAAARADRVIFLADGRLAGELGRPTAEQVAASMTSLGD